MCEKCNHLNRMHEEFEQRLGTIATAADPYADLNLLMQQVAEEKIPWSDVFARAQADPEFAARFRAASVLKAKRRAAAGAQKLELLKQALARVAAMPAPLQPMLEAMALQTLLRGAIEDLSTVTAVCRVQASLDASCQHGVTEEPSAAWQEAARESYTRLREEVGAWTLRKALWETVPPQYREAVPSEIRRQMEG